MKKLYFILLIVAAWFVFTPTISAQSINDVIKDPNNPDATLVFPKDMGLQQPANADFAYSKNISSPFSDGTYWIKLESFSTGVASFVQSAAPADIVLVLDLSSSMTNPRTVIDSYTTLTTPTGGWTYRNVRDQGYYILYEGEYYQVQSHGQGNNRYISFTDDANTYYLWRDGVVTTQPGSGQVGQDTSIYTGTLYQANTHSETRLVALKNATKAFIDEIEKNDKYEDEAGTIERKIDGVPTRLGNRISIITFNSSANTRVTLDNGALTDGTAATLKTAVDGFTTASGTTPYNGFVAANAQLATISEARKLISSRTVVFFTDGEPYDSGDRWKAVGEALITKTDYDAKVFSVGLFSNTQPRMGDTWRFLNYISSNAPNATDYNTPGEGWKEDAGYYYDASDPQMDLTKVFTDIAKQSGGSMSALSASSKNVDVVSNSFILPEGTNASNIDGKVKIFIAKIDTINADRSFVFEEEILRGSIPDSPEYYFDVLDDDGVPTGARKKVDEGITVSLGANNTITVKGFDYSSNFCGPIYKEGYTPPETGNIDRTQILRCNGFKIIIMIPILMNPEAVGGPNVATNGPGSGIFVSDDAQTAFVGYDSPTVSLPVNIHLTKTGLQLGESAKFKIERAELPDGEEGKDWTPENIPEAQWKYVSTVFVTKTSASTEPLVKVRGMPATTKANPDDEEDDTQIGFIYRITEEDWSWSYNQATGPQYTRTSKVDNPFTFSNSKKPNIEYNIRHAESKATNVFKNGDFNPKYNDSKDNGRTQYDPTPAQSSSGSGSGGSQ